MMKLLPFLLALLILFALAPTASAACVDNATRIVFEEQGANLVAVIGFTIVLIAAAYAAGSFFTNMRYVVFAKDELYHLGVSVLMLAAFSGIVVFSCMLLDFFYKSTFPQLGELPSGCYVEGSGMEAVSSCYMNLMTRDAKKMSEYHIQSYLDNMMDSTWSVGITWPLLNAYTVTGGAYKRVVSNQYDTILNLFLIPALMSISMQKLALDFISANVIRWILPVAFLLRIFIPTRQLGDMLIALSLGVYVVVPFMYVFSLTMYDALDCLAPRPPDTSRERNLFVSGVQPVACVFLRRICVHKHVA